MGTIKDDFHSRGTRPVEIERLKIWQRGVAMEWAVDLSIQAEIPSGPDAVLEGRFKIRVIMSLLEHSREVGQVGGSGSGGMGEGGGVEVLKHDEKKELRHWVLSELEMADELLDSRVGIEEGDLRRDLTNDQNFEGELGRE